MKVKFSSFLLLIIISISLSSLAYGDRPKYVIGSYIGNDNEGTGIVEVSEVTEITSKYTGCLDTGVILKLNGWWIDEEFVSFGEKIYFLACKMKNNKKKNFRLYEFDMETKKYKLLYKLPSKYTEGSLFEVYDNSVYMRMEILGKSKQYCLRYYIESGKLKTIYKSTGYYRDKDVLVSREKRKGSDFLGAKYNKEIIVYSAKTGKKKSVFKGYAEGMTRIGRYLYYAVSIDDAGFSVNYPSLYKIIRYDLVTGKKKTLLKSGKFLEIKCITGRYVYHGTWYCNPERYYRYDLKLKKNKKISSDTDQKEYEALMRDPDAETSLS